MLEGEAWMAAAAGDVAAARARLDEGADEAIDGGQRAVAARLLHDMARLGDPHGALPRLQRIAASTESPLIRRPVGSRSCAGRRRWLGPGRRCRAPSTAWALDSSPQKQPRPLPRRSDASASAAGRRRSRIGRASLLDDCEGAQTPAVAELEHLSPLTARERAKIADMAAAGVASKVIAERLFLSNRTVDNHLQRIYSKLGIPGRRQLADALGVEASAEPGRGDRRLDRRDGACGRAGSRPGVKLTATSRLEARGPASGARRRCGGAGRPHRRVGALEGVGKVSSSTIFVIRQVFTGAPDVVEVGRGHGQDVRARGWTRRKAYRLVDMPRETRAEPADEQPAS